MIGEALAGTRDRDQATCQPQPLSEPCPSELSRSSQMTDCSMVSVEVSRPLRERAGERGGSLSVSRSEVCVWLKPQWAGPRVNRTQKGGCMG